MIQSPLTVSVIIPCYNAAAFISDALSTIFAQSYPASLLEVIVVDDGSEDKTAEIVGSEHSTVFLIKCSRRGTAAARNAGVSASHGSLICFMDADDLSHPLRIERQVEEFRSNPELGVCFTNFMSFNHSSGHTIETLRNHQESPVSSFRLPGTIMVSRNHWDIIGPFDESVRLGEFLEWIIRATELNIPFIHIRETLYYRRVHLTNYSRDRSNYSDYARILAKHSRNRTANKI